MIQLAALATLLTVLLGPDVPPGEQPWVYPVGPPGGPAEVVRVYDPPDQPWLAGHRGTDLRGTAGEEVRAAAAGRVSYAGQLAGIGVVVVDHGGTRSTYQPVEPTVTVGDVVGAGDPIGTLSARGSHCPPAACLHWGVREADSYTDPLSLIRADARLLPLGGRSVSGAPPPPGAPPPLIAPPAGTALIWPVSQPRVTSPFGMRVHPVTGVYKLHDGTDVAASCGTPVRAAATGRVTHAGTRGAYGLQVTIEHGVIGGARTTTSYSHLARTLVAPRQIVRSGEVIGQAGTTGSSTGCHLHFMVYTDGALTDPVSRLPGDQPARGAINAPAHRRGRSSASAGCPRPRCAEHPKSP